MPIFTSNFPVHSNSLVATLEHRFDVVPNVANPNNVLGNDPGLKEFLPRALEFLNSGNQHCAQQVMHYLTGKDNLPAGLAAPSSEIPQEVKTALSDLFRARQYGISSETETPERTITELKALSAYVNAPYVPYVIVKKTALDDDLVVLPEDQSIPPLTDVMPIDSFNKVKEAAGKLCSFGNNIEGCFDKNYNVIRFYFDTDPEQDCVNIWLSDNGKNVKSIGAPYDPPNAALLSKLSEVGAIQASLLEKVGISQSENKKDPFSLNAFSATGHLNEIKEASTFSSCLNTKGATDIRNYLATQKAIKVAVFGGGGYGHQRAAVTGMQRLIELGFNGEFLLITEGNNVKSRLDFLLKSNPQIKVRHVDQSSEEKLPLGYCFALDFPMFTPPHQTYNVEHFVLLAPTDWIGPMIAIDSAQNGDFALMEQEREILDKGILEANSCDPGNGSIGGSVSKLISGRDVGQFQMISVYGLYDWPNTDQGKISPIPEIVGLTPEQEIDVLVKGLLTRSPSCKSIVVSILSDVDIHISKSSSRVKVVRRLEDFDPSTLKNGDIVLLKCARLPPHEFNAVVRNSDLFVAEGSNSISFAKREGIPFIIGGRQYSCSDGLPNNPAYTAASRALTFAIPDRLTYEEIQKYPIEQRSTDLGRFVSDCLEGRNSASYSSCQRNFTSRTDKVFASLMMVRAREGNLQGK